VSQHCQACRCNLQTKTSGTMQASSGSSHEFYQSVSMRNTLFLLLVLEVPGSSCECVSVCRRLEEAVRWSAAVQKALLGMNWPETLLQWGDCQPTRDPNTGALLWRGLRVRMGMSWGRPSYKKPLNTGAPSVTSCVPTNRYCHSVHGALPKTRFSAKFRA